MNSTDLKDRFRSDVDDLVADYLWTDADIYAYMTDAQNMLCREVGGIPDATNPVTTTVTFKAGDVWAATHPSILKMRGAYHLNGKPVAIHNFEDFEAAGVRLDDRTKNTIDGIVLGMEDNKVRLYPIPDADGSIQLLIDRLPLKAITDDDQKLEVAAQHHEGLLLWMKHKAYSKQDGETYDKTAAEDFEVRFMNYCADAKREKDRAKHKTRTVSYGGL